MSPMSTPLFIVPGLGDSGPTHWQSDLEQRRPGTLRLRDAPWKVPDLELWVAELAAQLSTAPDVVLVAHSFGCLAASRLLQRDAGRVRAALLVAPADPCRFGIEGAFRARALDVPAVLVASENDPWCDAEVARRLALAWDAQHMSVGRAGHINVASGHGRWPLGERLADTLARTYGGAGRALRAYDAHRITIAP